MHKIKDSKINKLCPGNDAKPCPGNDAKLIRCVLGMTLNSSVVVQGMTVKLWPCLRFRRVDEAVSGGKPPAGKGVVGMLS